MSAFNFRDLTEAVDRATCFVLMRSEKVHERRSKWIKRSVVVGQGVIAEARWMWLARWRHRRLLKRARKSLPVARVVQR